MNKGVNAELTDRVSTLEAENVALWVVVGQLLPEHPQVVANLQLAATQMDDLTLAQSMTETQRSQLKSVLERMLVVAQAELDRRRNAGE